MIVVRRVLLTEKKKIKDILKDMSSTSAHYKDIYDFDAKEPRWSSADGRWVYYEGYGQRFCREKMDFLESINRDHPLWSPGGIGKSGNDICKGSDSDGKFVRFREDSEVKVIGEENEVIHEMIDGGDRYYRTSWNFSLMLSQFVEKCGMAERTEFFKSGGLGERWMKQDMYPGMMEDFKRFFDWIDGMIASNNEKKISLSDQTVKDYPRHYYEHISRLYAEYLDEIKVEEKKTFKFNPNAAVFVSNILSHARERNATKTRWTGADENKAA